MGRSIKPTEIRRLSKGGPIEVLSKSGFWTKYSLLSQASVEAVTLAVGFERLMGWVNSGEPFHHVIDDADRQQPDELNPSNVDPELERLLDEEEAIQSDRQSQSQSQSDGGGETTVEDIIRRIAGEMDVQAVSATLTTVDAMIDDKLKTYQPAADSIDSVVPLTVKVSIETPTIKVSKDGIFHNQFDKLVKLVAMGQHTYLPGPPGTGKSHAAEQVASVLGWRFASISLGPTTPESRMWGGMDAHGKFFEPPFVQLARYAQDTPDSGAVFCLDELDNGHAGVIATLNSAMANGWFTAPNGDVITMGKNFTIVGAANTFGTGPTAEFAGRNKLDPATLDRFAYLPWDTDLGVEKALVHQYLEPAAAKAWLDVWRTCRKNAKDNGLKVFCTMRGCVNGARLIAAGLDAEDVLMMVLGNKIPDDQWRKIKP